MKIGDKIKYLRDVKRMSQQELAYKLDVSLIDISSWELDYSLPDVLTLKKMCDLFDVSVDTFLNSESNIDQLQKKKIFDILLKRKFVFSLIVTILFIVLAINIYSNNRNISSYDEAFEELALQTTTISNQVDFNMKNPSINLPYPNINSKELDKIKSNLRNINIQTLDLKTPRNIDSSPIEALLERQNRLLNTLNLQQQNLNVYKSLNLYYEKDILNEHGEFKTPSVKYNIDFTENDFLKLDQMINTISNKTLNRSFSKALFRIQEQSEIRKSVNMNVQFFLNSEAFSELETLEDEEDYLTLHEKIRNDIQRIDNSDLQEFYLKTVDISLYQ